MRRHGVHLRTRLFANLIALIFIASLAAALTGGCTTNLYLASNIDPAKSSQSHERVFVSNPNQQPEFDILRASKIYELANQTNDVPTLTLKPLGHGGVCGLGMLSTFFTLGIVPASLPTRISFNYQLERNGTTNSYLHMLPVYERYSFWELFFKPFKSDKPTLAKALAQSEPSGPIKAGPVVEHGVIPSANR